MNVRKQIWLLYQEDRLVFWEESSVSSPGKGRSLETGKAALRESCFTSSRRGDGNLYGLSSQQTVACCLCSVSLWLWVVLKIEARAPSAKHELSAVPRSAVCFFLIACEIWMDFYVFKELRDQKNILCHENCMNLKFFVSVAKTCRNWSHPLLLWEFFVVVVVPTCGCFLI